MDQRDFQSQVAAANAYFQNTQDQYDRSLRLANTDAVAESVLKQHEQARNLARSRLDLAEKALEDTVMRSPYHGNIAQVLARENQKHFGGRDYCLRFGFGRGTSQH